MKSRSFILFLISILCLVQMQGQNDTESIEKLTANKSEPEKLQVFLKLAEETKTVDLVKAIAYARQAISLANAFGSEEERAVANELLAGLFQMDNNFQPAINYYLISAKLYESLGEKKKLAEVYGKLGKLSFIVNFNPEGAMEYYNKALSLGIELNDQDLIAEIYNRIGAVYFRQKKYDEAHHYFNEALTIWERLGSEKGMAIALNNIGEIYRMQEKYDSALDYYEQSQSLNRKIDYKILLATTLENIGLVNSAKGNKKAAFTYFDQSFKITEEINDKEKKVELLLTMASQHMKYHNFAEAIKYYRTAYSIAKASNHWSHIAEASLGLANTYEKMLDYKNSFNYFKVYSSYNDSIVQKQKSNRINELEVRFKNDLQDKELQIAKNEITLLENEKKLNNLKLNILLLSVFFFVILSVLVINRYRSKMTKEKLVREKDAQLHLTQKELMETIIKGKDDDLMNFALHLVQKNEMLRRLQKDLKKLPCGTDDETNRTLAELQLAIQQNLHIKEEADEFQRKLDNSYDDFFYKLRVRFPNLTKNEEKLCAYLRLNLSSKEIAAINNTSVKAVEMSRYRLRKKMNLEFNEQLSEYLHKLQ